MSQLSFLYIVDEAKKPAYPHYCCDHFTCGKKHELWVAPKDMADINNRYTKYGVMNYHILSTECAIPAGYWLAEQGVFYKVIVRDRVL
jgi:hypothetical protein